MKIFSPIYRVAIGSLALCIGYISAQEIYLRHGTDNMFLPVELTEHAVQLSDEDRWAESKLVTDFIIEHPELGSVERARQLSTLASEQMNSFWNQSQSFAQGALTGEPKDTASMLGSLSLDFFMIGDIRDLAVQGWKTVYSGDGDSVVLALSAVGLATTLAPEIDWVPAMLKAFKRVGALSKRFLKNLRTISKQALKTGKFDVITRTTAHFGKAARHLGPGPLSRVMKHVDDPAQLKKVADAAAIDAKGTYVVGSVFGKNGVKAISRNSEGIGSVVAKIKVGSRLVKVSRKWVMIIPSPWLLIICLVSIFVAWRSFSLRSFRKWFQQRSVKPARQSFKSVGTENNIELQSQNSHL
ncbi:hypothetical protein ACFL17_06585 [Pseudomonadota bacterium]